MFLEVRAFDPEDIANMFGVPAHVAVNPDTLRPGYWERQLQRQIRQRSVAARLHRLRRRLRS
jgi:phage portal protein BeeE